MKKELNPEEQYKLFKSAIWEFLKVIFILLSFPAMLIFWPLTLCLYAIDLVNNVDKIANKK